MLGNVEYTSQIISYKIDIKIQKNERSSSLSEISSND
jgi:hypothetical protein